ncbi:hypothetical protein ACS0TY_026993 [Phlomoides rotata]
MQQQLRLLMSSSRIWKMSFFILIDECQDVPVKEHMGLLYVILVHVSDTTAISLEKDIDFLFSTYRLSISSLRGQGYDGASNMSGELQCLLYSLFCSSTSTHTCCYC